MSALSANRKTPEKLNPCLRQLTAGGTVYAGSLVALNADGKAVAASDTSGLVVIGRAEIKASVNDSVTVKSGCFRFNNSASTGEIKRKDIGTRAYVADDQTVSLLPGTNGVAAGLVYDVDGKGVWVMVGVSGAEKFAAAAHTHVISEVTGLQTALDGKTNAAG